VRWLTYKACGALMRSEAASRAEHMGCLAQAAFTYCSAQGILSLLLWLLSWFWRKIMP
jgi:hypothetical protein